MGVKPVFADVQKDTLNIDVEHVSKLISTKTKAIVCVHYGGLPCDMDELLELGRKHGIPVIEDGAHAVGSKYKGKSVGEISDFTMFSFQAIKHITTGDGGMLTFKNSVLRQLGERLRWFGIDRSSKQNGIWENDIVDIGYKYQMTDISAAMGLAAMEEIDETLTLRKTLLNRYFNNLRDNKDITIVGDGYADREHGAWMMTILVDRRLELMHKLRDFNIESSQVHYRNDRYSIFGGRQKGAFPNMDAIEDRYLVLPLHTKMNIEDVDYICDVIKRGW
jgi:dTDP-4-amino-4,6-dideoxygalactose transaminase